MTEIRDILSNNDGSSPNKITDEMLQAYLSGNLSLAEQRTIELLLSEEGMESDAVDGLKELNMNITAESVNNINRKLQQQLVTKKRKRNRYYNDNKWIFISAFVLLILVVLAYWVLHLMVNR